MFKLFKWVRGSADDFILVIGLSLSKRFRHERGETYLYGWAPTDIELGKLYELRKLTEFMNAQKLDIRLRLMKKIVIGWWHVAKEERIEYLWARIKSVIKEHEA